MIEIPETRTSYWVDSFQTPDYPQLNGELTVDVVIVGAGIVGLTSAYLLKQAGLTVAVIEKNYIGSGVTGYTTGKISSQHNLIYAKLAREHGLETAKVYGQANQAALNQITTIVTAEQIDCNWRREDSYVYTTQTSQLQKFHEEVDAARACGLPVSFETETDLPFTIAGAVKFEHQASFHSRKYLAGLAKRIHGDGSYVFESSKVISINSGHPPHVSTLEGKVFARDVIVATNIPTHPLAARATYAASVYPQQSYIVAGRMPTDLHGMYISPDSGQYSILPVYGDDGAWLFIGGEGHIPGTRWNAETRYKRLADYARKHFGVEDIEYTWSHRDYLGYDDMPLIGRLYPWSKHMWTATGFMKWGLTNGTVAGMILSDLVQGRANPWATTFSTLRPQPVLSIPKVVAEKLSSS